MAFGSRILCLHVFRVDFPWYLKKSTCTAMSIVLPLLWKYMSSKSFPRELIATELSPKFFFTKPWKYLEIQKCNSRVQSGHMLLSWYWEDFFWLQIPFYVWWHRERRNLALCFRLYLLALLALLAYCYQQVKKILVWFGFTLSMFNTEIRVTSMGSQGPFSEQ